MTLFLKVSKGNNLISKSRAFHNVGAAYTKDLSKNELAHVLLIGGTHNKQGSNDARVRIVVLLTLRMVVYGGVCWCMVVYGGALWCMVVVWRCMVVYDDVWWCIVVSGGVWW